MPASGDDGADLDVGRRAGQRAGVREAVEQRDDDLHQALAPQLLVGVERRAAVVGQPVGHARAEQALDRRDEDDGDDEVDQVAQERPVRSRIDRSAGGVKTAEVGRDLAVLVSDQRQALVGPDRRRQQRADARARSAARG